MKNKKTDQRSKYTQTLIKKALLRLTISKPLNKITITELCSEAHTSRITFYSHFYDIYDAYETIENDFCNEIMEKLAALKTFTAEASVIQEVILHLYRNADICNLFVKNNGTAITKIMNAALDQYVTEFSSTYKQVPLDMVNQLFIYLLDGGVGLIIDWIKKGMKQPPEEVAIVVLSFNKYALESITKNFILQRV